MVDEMTDVSNSAQLAVVLSYVMQADVKDQLHMKMLQMGDELMTLMLLFSLSWRKINVYQQLHNSVLDNILCQIQYRLQDHKQLFLFLLNQQGRQIG